MLTNPLSANPTKWSNTLKQFVEPTNRLSMFDHFVGLALKELKSIGICAEVYWIKADFLYEVR